MREKKLRQCALTYSLSRTGSFLPSCSCWWSGSDEEPRPETKRKEQSSSNVRYDVQVYFALKTSAVFKEKTAVFFNPSAISHGAGFKDTAKTTSHCFWPETKNVATESLKNKSFCTGSIKTFSSLKGPRNVRFFFCFYNSTDKNINNLKAYFPSQPPRIEMKTNFI